MLGRDDARNYFAEHFWEKYLSETWNYPSDTTMVRGVANKNLEEAVAGYITLLSSLPLETTEAYVRRFVGALISIEAGDTTSIVFDVIKKQYERYSYDPNSPVRDEDLYGIWASVMQNCSLVCESERERYAQDARLCLLNKRGTVATDFRFSYRDGRVGRMVQVHAPYTLLFFSNPGCTACKEIIEELSTNPEIVSMVKNGTLAVINIYIDEDMEGWLKYMPIYPTEWHNVFDADGAIRAEELYNVRAIPSLYLLNINKAVILKDADPGVLYNKLIELNSK